MDGFTPSFFIREDKYKSNRADLSFDKLRLHFRKQKARILKESL